MGERGHGHYLQGMRVQRHDYKEKRMKHVIKK